MSTTQIPPSTPAPQAEGGELYDAQRWESAYREMHDAPALLVQLQDDLSRSRQREAFWISVVFHLVVVILVVYSPNFEQYLPKRPVFVVSPNDWMRQKELTYLEMPPDAQKVPKRPDTNNISDKDRIASSRTPQPDREELRKILDSARQGAPGASAPPAEQQQASPPVAQNPPARPANQNQMAQMQAPPLGKPKPTFRSDNLSPGSAIEQAARAAAANRGGYGGDNGDFGLGQGKQPTQTLGQLEVLSDTMGVDFAPYLSRITREVYRNWLPAIPESVRSGFKKGKLSIEFAILKDGRVAGLQVTDSSGDVALDRAAWSGIKASELFPPLPNEFPGQYLSVRFRFCYNLDQCLPQ
jgi:TonB family protein